jgi:hypothetical protein
LHLDAVLLHSSIHLMMLVENSVISFMYRF